MLLSWNIYFFLLFSFCSKLNAWSFKNATTWYEEYPSCGGTHQSPIDITKELLDTTIEGKGQIEFTGMDKVAKRAKLLNNGHELSLIQEWDDSSPGLSGGPLNGNYILEKIDIRWPAPHTMDGKNGPLAFHLVYHNEKYRSLDESLGKEDGVAQVVYSFEIGVENDAFNIMLNDTDNVHSTPYAEVYIEPLAISAFNPQHTNQRYLTYSGSLTLPPCSESVTWILSTNIFQASQDQIDKIRTSAMINGDKENYRPTQPINNRILTAYKGNI